MDKGTWWAIDHRVTKSRTDPDNLAHTCASDEVKATSLGLLAGHVLVPRTQQTRAGKESVIWN